MSEDEGIGAEDGVFTIVNASTFLVFGANCIFQSLKEVKKIPWT